MNKIISLIVISTTVFVGSFFFTKDSQAQNIGGLRNVITPGFSFKKDLRLGDTDPDIKELQKVLNADIDTVVATAGPGSTGQESTYFGSLTKAAVIKFQNKYKGAALTVIDGAVDKATRTKLNLLSG